MLQNSTNQIFSCPVLRNLLFQNKLNYAVFMKSSINKIGYFLVQVYNENNKRFQSGKFFEKVNLFK